MKRLATALLASILLLPTAPVSGDPEPEWVSTCGEPALDMLSLMLAEQQVTTDVENPDPASSETGTLVVDVTLDGENLPIGIPLTVAGGHFSRVRVTFPANSPLVVHSVSICDDEVTGIVEAPDPVQIEEDEQPTRGQGTNGNGKETH